MEYLIAFFFGIAGVCGIGLMVVYYTGGQDQFEGGLLALAAGCLGVGLLLWARFLLPGHEITASRGHHVSDPEERAAVVESLSRGTDAMLSRRGFLAKKVLVPVGGIFGIALLWPLASLGTRPGRALYHTKWYSGARLVTEDGRPIHVDDVMVDGQLTVFPEGYADDASSPAILLNIGGAPVQARPGQASFEVISGANGLVCFSKICTHAGCAVSLFNVLSMQLICPCHQSTFNILQDAPRSSARPPGRCLSSLGCRPDGYLIAMSDFIEPIGPGLLEPDRGLRWARRLNLRGKAMSTVAERSAARKRARRQEQATRLGGRPFRGFEVAALGDGQDLPGPLVVHGGRDRNVLLRYVDCDGHLPGIVLQGLQNRGDLPRDLQPLDGQSMTEAFASTVNLSFSVRAGLLCARRTTGPRTYSWLQWRSTCAGYFSPELPQASGGQLAHRGRLCCYRHARGFLRLFVAGRPAFGFGLRVVFSIVQSIPFVGTWLAFTVWGGRFPGQRAFFVRLFVIHEFLFPLPYWQGCWVGTWRSCGTKSTPTSPGRARPSTTSLVAAFGRSTWSSPPLSHVHRRRHIRPRRNGPDQPHLDIRSVRSGPVERRHSARLVRGVVGRGFEVVAALGVPQLRPRDPQPVLPRIVPPGLFSRSYTPGHGSTSAFLPTTRSTTFSSGHATGRCVRPWGWRRWSSSSTSLWPVPPISSVTALQMSFELLIEILQYGSFVGPIWAASSPIGPASF